MTFLESRRIRRVVEIALGAFALGLCWIAVSWAFRPGLSMILDELSNLTRFLTGPYSAAVHFWPDAFYSDRPVGFAFIRLLYDLFGFDYGRQVTCQLAIHFANCSLAYALFRRLGAGAPLCLAAIGLYGSLSTTALTATYIGEAFDVICLFLMLSSALAALPERRGANVASALLFLAALRTKELAIVTPALLTILLATFSPKQIWRRLWMHYAILAVFGLRYLGLASAYFTSNMPDNPYHMSFRASTVLDSLAYYTGLILGLRWPLPSWILAALLAGILVWAAVRRRTGILFGITAYILTAFSVFLMPNLRIPYWMYVPQLFLILAVALLLERLIAVCLREERWRWAAAVCLALVCLSAATRFRRSPVLWHISVRRACWRTATDAARELPSLAAGAHIYVNSGTETAWLFRPGPCDYFKLVNKQRDIACVLGKPRSELRALYDAGRGPGYFVDYRADGSITLAARNAAY